MFSIKLIPNDRSNPPGKLADVELHFVDVACECVLCEGSGQAAIQLASGDHRLDPCGGCHGTGRQSNPLAGLKLIGFGIWERRGGSGRNVTFPARQYSVNGERRSFALLRPIVDATAQDHIRERILHAYAVYESTAQASGVGR